MSEIEKVGILFSKEIVEAARNEYEYIHPELFLIEKIKIFFRLMKRPRPIKIKRRSIMDLMPKVKAPRFKYEIGDIT